MTVATYIFDPLCGWCYGAAPAVERLVEEGCGLELLPIGQPEEARPIEPEFAGLIWDTDRLVAQHTGQPFTRAYQSLLSGGEAQLDAWPATLALIAVARTRPDRQMAALHALQVGRFVNGRDTGDARVVETILREIGLRNAADLLAEANPVLTVAVASAVARGRAVLAHHGMDGGPAVLLSGSEGPRLLSGQKLLAQVEARKPQASPQGNPLPEPVAALSLA